MNHDHTFCAFLNVFKLCCFHDSPLAFYFSNRMNRDHVITSIPRNFDPDNPGTTRTTLKIYSSLTAFGSQQILTDRHANSDNSKHLLGS